MKIYTIMLMLILSSVWIQAQDHGPGLEDKIEGMFIGSAIGDAAGGPVEFVKPPLRSQWTTTDRPITQEAKEGLAELFLLKAYPKEAEPFAQWEAFGPAGTITDDTRFKMIFFSTLKNYPGELTREPFARSVLEFRKELPEKYRDKYDQWIPEIEYATRWTLVAGLARALQADGSWENMEAAMREVDPFGYNKTLYVNRELSRWLDVVHSVAQRADGNIATLYTILEKELQATYWWEAWEGSFSPGNEGDG